MAKRASASSRHAKRAGKNEESFTLDELVSAPEYQAEIKRVQALSDEEADFSEIPEWSKRDFDRLFGTAIRRKKVKQGLSVRLDEDVIRWLKRHGEKGYSGRINDILRNVMLLETKLKRQR